MPLQSNKLEPKQGKQIESRGLWRQKTRKEFWGLLRLTVLWVLCSEPQGGVKQNTGKGSSRGKTVQCVVSVFIRAMKIQLNHLGPVELQEFECVCMWKRDPKTLC